VQKAIEERAPFEYHLGRLDTFSAESLASMFAFVPA
jgi:hypothetical protein